MSTPDESTSSPVPPAAPGEPAPATRREFMKSAACVALGGACVLAPVAAGVAVLVSPLAKPAQDGTWVKLTTLGQLALGGAPQLFQIIVERTDAWTRHAQNAVGSVFLERTGEREVRAFHSACPHLGGSVVWRAKERDFYCPIHLSSFTKDGAVVQPSPSARALDTLAVEIRGEDEVWVRFQDFKAGIKDKVPVA